MELYLYPADFKAVLRHWLLLFPDKVVFGSDAFPFSDAVGAEGKLLDGGTGRRENLSGGGVLGGDGCQSWGDGRGGGLFLRGGICIDNAAGLYPR